VVGEEVSPEPTFLERLRKIRAGATPRPWIYDNDEDGDGDFYSWIEDSKQRPIVSMAYRMYEGGHNSDLICFLVNNAEKIERLIEAATRLDCCISLPEDSAPDRWEEWDAALAALNEDVR
jgi:hypothetical protein